MGRFGLPIALLLASACSPVRPAWQPVGPSGEGAPRSSEQRRVEVVGWQQLAPPLANALGSAPGAALPAGGVAPSAAPAQGGAAAGTADAAPDAANDDVDDPDDELVDEGPDAPVIARPAPRAPSAPIIKLTNQEIAARLKDDPASLGPMSIGSTNAGSLMNGVQMPRGEFWEIVDPSNAWGTRETVDFLARSIEKVHEIYPGAPPLFIGHISAKHGRRLSPHVSHQAGRDVDISYYLLSSRRGFIKASADNLDLAKTWAFVRALITETDVEMILIDTSIQRLLDEYASNRGEDAAWLDQVFQVRGKNRAAVVRHAKGHVNHLHIRFYSPLAQEMGRRVYPMLARSAEVHVQAESFVLHKARKGDTLGSLARRYGTTVEAIMKANNLRSNAIHATHVYRIPKKGRVLPPPGPVVVPARRAPPARTAVSAR